MSTSYHVYGNGGAGAPVDYTASLATVSGTSWATPALAAGSDWRFGVRAFDTVSGLEETNVDASVEISVSAGGTDASDTPQAPTLVTATPVAGGGVRVDWSYPVAAARALWRPSGFHVYGGTPTASFGTPLATVPYSAVSTFRAGLTGLTAGSPYQIVVRAYNASGEETNTNAAAVTPASAGPDGVVGLTATVTTTMGDGGSGF